jgi:hypothetical protein
MGLLGQSWLACRWNLGYTRECGAHKQLVDTRGQHCGRCRAVCLSVIFRTQTERGRATFLTRRHLCCGTGEKQRGVCCGLLHVCTLITFHKGLETVGSCTCMLCRKGSMLSRGVNAAEHSRSASERSQPIRFVISVHTYTSHTRNLAGSSVLLPRPAAAAAYESKRVSHWVSFSTTSRIRTKPHSKTKQECPCRCNSPRFIA